jgi:hypothetical protein
MFIGAVNLHSEQVRLMRIEEKQTFKVNYY